MASFTWSSMGTGSDAVFKFTNRLHRAIFTATNGRLMGKFFGMPVVMLTTTGRKTGQPRTSMLTSPVRDGDKVVIVASKGGAPKHPAWFLNLKANPDVEALYEGKKRKMHAHIATPEEKERLWPQVVASYKGYGQYQTKTDRDIPLVLLEEA
jgi:deazaflavin-dependent oxidoreductase (nitroreductase family)